MTPLAGPIAREDTFPDRTEKFHVGRIRSRGAGRAAENPRRFHRGKEYPIIIRILVTQGAQHFRARRQQGRCIVASHKGTLPHSATEKTTRHLASESGLIPSRDPSPHANVRPDIRNLKLRAFGLPAKIAIKSNCRCARIAPNQSKALLPGVNDARRNQRATNPKPAHLGNCGHATQLQCRKSRPPGHFGTIKRCNSHQLSVSLECTEMLGIRRIIPGELSGSRRPAGTQHLEA